jgi:hypothetical protein
VHHELAAHAARVLLRTPSRTLDAAALYARVSRETGICCGASLFLDRLQAEPDRFAILPPAQDVDEEGCWSDVERLAYAPALAPAGLGRWPLVTLCDDPEEARPGSGRPGSDGALAGCFAGALAGAGAGADAGAGPEAESAKALPPCAEPLRDVHRSVAELLRTAGADTELRSAAGAAVAALDRMIWQQQRS